MAYDIEGIIKQMMTKKEQNENDYTRTMAADANVFNRGLANRQASLAEQALEEQKRAQRAKELAIKREQERIEKSEEMDWSDWLKLIVGTTSESANGVGTIMSFFE